jgi:glycosyltransferase involved in cell wall biosynthesis
MFRESGYNDALQAWVERSKGMATLHMNAGDDVKLNLMKRARATIMPSNFGEPFGLVALESMACGTPAIVTSDGGLPEVVGTGPEAGGFICDTYAQIVDAVRNSHKINPNTCRKRAEMFSREIMAENYLNYYKEALNGNEW